MVGVPVTDEPDNRQREELLEQLAEFPHELARCTCGTPSFNRDDHANTCPLGPTPPLSSNPSRPLTRDLPEFRF
jgi:hypothetical protein